MSNNHEDDLIDQNDAKNPRVEVEEPQETDATQATDTAQEETEQSPLEKELEEAKVKADENWDKYLRLQAEMDNLRRRNEKQVEDAHKYAVKNFAESLLPVVDSLEMGMQAEGDVDKIREGMDLTLKQLLDAMRKYKLEVVDPEGEPFNPDLHQAISMQPSDQHEDNHVVSVMQKGYTLNGRLMRPAMVMVCKN
jgi:molecular chaperone GrpE